MPEFTQFERRGQPLVSNRVFIGRLSRNALWSLVIVVASMVVGTGGYMYFEHMPAIDAFSNAAMILSGMGPLTPLFTTGGKIFA
eukprot:gene19991-25592_t